MEGQRQRSPSESRANPKRSSVPNLRHHRSLSSKRTARTGSVHEYVASAPASRDDAKSPSPALPVGQASQGRRDEAPRTGALAAERGWERRSLTAAEKSESPAQQDCDCPSAVDAATAQGPESSMSERTASVAAAPPHRPSCALGLLQGADSDALLGRADEGAVMHRLSTSSTPQLSRLEAPQIVNSEESAWQNPEKARAPSGVSASSGIQGSESPRALTLSPVGTAAAALAAAASYAPFVGVDYDVVTGPRADEGEAAMGPEAACAADAGATESQLPDTGAGTGRPYRPRGLRDGAALKPLFDLLVQLDCFWLAQDLFSGDTQRVQSSIRVLATMALLLLVLWLAAVPNSAEKVRPRYDVSWGTLAAHRATLKIPWR
ncbi:uncharacterized protein [Dermacentor andersoni]|uniref:uncharacterized protein n=1 Tax=Dermacentor andersoni TaxID=34620 RepID=UPI002415F635|nr:uncharacterized protein LOC129386454 [Dermacentor andersoni]